LVEKETHSLTETGTRHKDSQKSERTNQTTNMSSLRSKSAEDISELLDEYGIKHGPVVGEWLTFCARVWISLHGSCLHRPAGDELVALLGSCVSLSPRRGSLTTRSCSQTPPEVSTRGSWKKPWPKGNRQSRHLIKPTTEKRVILSSNTWIL